MEKYMMDIISIILSMEKQYYIIMMVADMKEITKMIIEKEKEYVILRMEIEKWEIIYKEKKLVCMLNYQ